jgi:hypothetical protein
MILLCLRVTLNTYSICLHLTPGSRWLSLPQILTGHSAEQLHQRWN